MKSSYELAMERLSKTTPTQSLTDKQKQRLSELEAEYKAKIADRELFLKGQMVKAAEKDDLEGYQAIEKQLVHDRKTFQTELEEKKEKIRQEKKK